MTDKELIQLAAKAAGITLVPYTWNKGTGWDHEGFYVAGDRSGSEWNPIENDGDAFRLAVALNLDILQDPLPLKTNSVEVVANDHEHAGVQPWAWEFRAPDPVAATRRAIVRVAAEIGKNKESNG